MNRFTCKYYSLKHIKFTASSITNLHVYAKLTFELTVKGYFWNHYRPFISTYSNLKVWMSFVFVFFSFFFLSLFFFFGQGNSVLPKLHVTRRSKSVYQVTIFFFSPCDKLKRQQRINRKGRNLFFSGLANLRFGKKCKLIFIARILCCVAAIIKFKYAVNWCEVWNQEFRKIREILITSRATPCQSLM